MADYLLQEDGSSKFILEDASGDLLLQSSPDPVAAPFIASVTTVHAPSVTAAGLVAPFISSVTVAHAPTLAATTVHAPFISSVTVVRPPSFPGPGFNPISEDFIASSLEFEVWFGQDYDDFTLDVTPTSGIAPPFISRTVVYEPSLSPFPLHPSFIGSVTSFYSASLAFSGTTLTVSTAGTYTWLCPPGVTFVEVQCFGGGGPGDSDPSSLHGLGGGGGGAYAARTAVPVTPGTVYTFVVGAAGAIHAAGGDSSFTGDSSVQVLAKGGHAGSLTTGGAGGAAGSSIGDSGLVHSGGSGGTGTTATENGGGGGASGNVLATGAAGANSNHGGTPPMAGGVGANGGGTGGAGGVTTPSINATHGTSPGAGGGGGAFNVTGATGIDGKLVISISTIAMPFKASTTVVYTARTNPQTVLAPFIHHVSVFTPTLTPQVDAPFIHSVTVYTPEIRPHQVFAPFISSHTVVYIPALAVYPPFISSTTVVYPIMSVFDPNRTYGGPGNGGEAFVVELNANGVTTTATLAADIGLGFGSLSMTGDSGLPTGVAFVVTIDAEQIYVFPQGGGNYKIHGRGLGNTPIAVHAAGDTVSWGDSYDQAIVAAADIGHQFTADINSTGSFTYPGWLVCFDASQAYLSGARYPMHVTSVVGVFGAGEGDGGVNRCDAAQPNAISVPAAISDDCPASLSNPSRISSDINTGDVAVVRYTNPEATPLDLGPRAVTLQSWYGLKRVDTTDHDVTFTDPTGIVVDTTGAQLTFTGSVEDTWLNPSSIGISPGTGLPTPGNVPYTTVTLPGIDRKMTYGTAGGGYDEKGWPICCLAVRQGNRRVPYWQSWDWHDFNYIYTGFGTDALYAQLLINRNGINYGGSVPDVNYPGPQDTDGPDAVWDDGSYYFGAAWYVAIFNSPYLVFGPSVGGTTIIPPGGPIIPVVTFPSGGGGTPSIIYPVPPFVEGGSGGGIGNPPAGLHVWGTSGKGFQ